MHRHKDTATSISRLREEAARLKAAIRHQMEQHDHMSRILDGESLLR